MLLRTLNSFAQVFAYGADDEELVGENTVSVGGGQPVNARPPNGLAGMGADFDATAPPPVPSDDPWSALFTFIQPTVPAPPPVETSKGTNAVPIWV